MDLVSHWVVGFSGARHLKAAEQVRAALRSALEELKALADGNLVGCSSAAIGAALLFIEETARAGMPWIAVLPFPAEAFFNERDFPDAQERATARNWADNAADCEIVALPRSASETGDASWRHTAFADAGFRCVDEADVFVAVWRDTSEAAKPGGTSEVVAHARARKRPLLIIDPESGEATRENWPRVSATHYG